MKYIMPLMAINATEWGKWDAREIWDTKVTSEKWHARKDRKSLAGIWRQHLDISKAISTNIPSFAQLLSAITYESP